MLTRTHFSKELKNLQIGSVVRVAGWIEDFRDIGKLGFLTLRDVTGAIQSVLLGDNLQRQNLYLGKAAFLFLAQFKKPNQKILKSKF